MGYPEQHGELCMTRQRAQQWMNRWMPWIIIAFLFALYVWNRGTLLLGPIGNDPNEPAIRETGFFVVVGVLGFVTILAAKSPWEKQFEEGILQGRLWYTIGCVLC